MRYFQPKSLTWWAGIMSMIMGFLMMFNKSVFISELADVIGMLSGYSGSSPAQLIFIGLGLIGIREKLERLG